MSDKPEPLAAILAEMRASSLSTVRAWADRIDAAAEREREKAKDLSKELDGNRAITGNAAAMRAVLEKITNMADLYPRIPRSAFANTARAAIAAPARNVDRFATADDAAREYCRTAFFAGYEDPVIRAAFRWAFATSEGGDHA